MNILKNIIYKNITGNLGTIIEEEDKIICYIDKTKLAKDESILKFLELNINCKGIGEYDKKMIDLFKINKPITYVFKGINLHCLYINGHIDTNIIIEDCNFYGLTIGTSGDCILDNVDIKGHFGISSFVQKLDIKNAIINYSLDLNRIKLYVKDELNIIDSRIGKKNNFLDVKVINNGDINIHNSFIGFRKVNIESNNIKANKKSILCGTDEIDINSTQFYLPRVITPLMEINNEQIEVPKGEFQVKTPTSSIEIERHKLIMQLKNLKKQCEQSISNDTKTYKQELCNQSLSKRFGK